MTKSTKGLNVQIFSNGIFKGNTRNKMNKLLRQAGIQEDDLLIVSDVSVIGCATVIYCCGESVQNHLSPIPINLVPNVSPSVKNLEKS